MSNIKILITAIATMFWFKGMYRILDNIIPDTWFHNILMAIGALAFFYLNDGELNEIGKIQAVAQPARARKSEGMTTIPHNIASGKIPRLGGGKK